MKKSDPKIIAGIMRLPFLILPPVCVGLGSGAAVYAGYELNYLYLFLAFVGAMAAHISVNALNEYSDFKSGLDFKTTPTPFSGGSKTLPENPEKSNLALLTGLISLGIVIFTGIYFLTIWGLKIVPLGIIGIILVVAYTSFITKSPIICLIAPGLGFGPLMVTGTYFILTGSYSWTAFFSSLVPFFLVNNLLLLNQFPDVEADKAAGRKHFPITIGRKNCARIFILFLLATYTSIGIGFYLNYLPITAFLAYLSIIIAIPTASDVLKHYDDIPELIPSMGKNVMINLITPVLLTIGLLIFNSVTIFISFLNINAIGIFLKDICLLVS